MRRLLKAFSQPVFISLALSLLIYNFFKLTMTLPLILVGLAVLISQRSTKNKIIKLICVNFGIFLTAIGTIFSILNLNKLAKNDEVISKVQQKHGVKLIGNDAQGLGYAYPPNLKNHSATKIISKKKFPKFIAYNVTYNTDHLSNRYTPFTRSSKPDIDNAILFLGDSLTFGTGLNDIETLPFFVQDKTGRSSLNAAMGGYGGHQVLKILEDDNLYNKRTSGHIVKTIVYRVILAHINRTAGHSAWDKFGPCYEINETDSVTYKGSFERCGNSNLKRVNGVIGSSSEPFTRQLFKKLFIFGRSKRGNSPEDVERFLAVTREIERNAKSRGANFLMILEDTNRKDHNCGLKIIDKEMKFIKKRLRLQHKNLILTSNIYTKKECLRGQLAIKYDGHPTGLANKIMAEYLVKKNFLN